MSGNTHAEVICPYYHGEGDCHIRCESPVRAMNLHVNLRSRKQLDRFRENLCASFYYAERCPIARLNQTKYTGGCMDE